jgi:hypothetical protein
MIYRQLAFACILLIQIALDPVHEIVVREGVGRGFDFPDYGFDHGHSLVGHGFTLNKVVVLILDVQIKPNKNEANLNIHIESLTEITRHRNDFRFHKTP